MTQDELDIEAKFRLVIFTLGVAVGMWIMLVIWLLE